MEGREWEETTMDRINTRLPFASAKYAAEMLECQGNPGYYPFDPCIVCGDTSVTWEGPGALCKECRASVTKPEPWWLRVLRRLAA